MALVKNSIELGKSPINTSPSKVTFSFSKSVRFPNLKANAAMPKLYTPKDVWNYRSAGIGYGFKYPINKKSTTPSPTQYTVKFGFAQKKKSDGYIFGASRDKVKNVLHLSVPNGCCARSYQSRAWHL
jgi:hypothetical protein